MSTELEVLDVEVTPLPMPLRLAHPAFLTALKDCETQIAVLQASGVTDAASAQLAATLNGRLTTAGKMLEDTRAKLKAPVLEQGRKIDEAAKAPALRIATAKATLQRALTTYDQEQQRKAREAEDARQAELRRLEALRLAEERAAQAKAAELAKELAFRAEVASAPIVTLAGGATVRVLGEGPNMRWLDTKFEATAKAWLTVGAITKAQIEAAIFAGKLKDAPPPPMEVSFDDEAAAEPPPKTATELAIEAVKHAPAVVVERPRGVAFRVSLRHVVTDLAKLPEPFVKRQANDMAIRAAYCTGYKDGEPLPVCPGVRFEVERTPIDTGRAVF